MTDRKIYKPRPISGFPEWLPEVRRVEQQWMDHIRRVFESYGYCSIETPAVEELDVINVKGEGGQDVDKEVYVIERLHKEPGDKEARLALHFDQTVPLARYTAQHFDKLVFPFKRYQMQKVWRGERPQAGRFREFYQCDIDVINVDNLPLHFDAEMPAVMWQILSSLPGMENERIQIRISNRKILMGFLDDLGVPDPAYFLRLIDKMDKIGMVEFKTQLKNTTNQAVVDKISRFAEISQASTSQDLNRKISQLLCHPGESRDPTQLKDEAEEWIPASAGMTKGMALMQEGLSELSFVMDQLSHLPPGAVVADLSIVRGLDYYTGTVYETVFLEDPGYGSICSGGRYDDLAGNYISKKLPGVGISIGLSRLFDRLRTQGKLQTGRISPADILVLLLDESHRPACMKKAADLRARGFNVETYHAPQKIGKQFAYAEKKGIPFVFVPMDDATTRWEVKNTATREQKPEAEGLADLQKVLQ